MKTSKAHLDYWKSVLRKQKLPKETWETSGKSRDWEVYLQNRGRREWFNLHTPNKEAAASLAREIYLTLKGAGWDAAMQKFKPEMIRALKQPTVGEYLAAVGRSGSLKPYTLHTYSRKLRSMVAAMIGCDTESRKYHASATGNLAWRARIDSIRLDRITLSRVQDWKAAALQAAGDSPFSQAQARRTINSTLRNAKSLFAERIRKQLPFVFTPPLQDAEFERVAKPRYHSKINPGQLVQAAIDELQTQDPEGFIIFVLALYLGLRRKEIDGLLWSQIDYSRGVVSIETNHYTELKSPDSEDEIDLSPEVAAFLKGHQETSFTEFVVAAPKLEKYRPGEYRCERHFCRVIDWLRGKGISDDKPLHTLRKEFGSVIAAMHGIFAASSALRHSNITVTRDHYLDRKAPVYFSATLSQRPAPPRVSNG